MSNPRFVRFSLSILLAGGLIIVALLELFVRQALIPNDVVAIKDRLLASQREHIRVLGLGDSHVLNGLTTGSPELFNYAKGGDTTPIFYFKLKRVLADHTPVEVLMLQLDYNLFSSYRTRPGGVPRLYAHLIDEPVEPSIGYYPAGNEGAVFYSMGENYGPILFSSLGKYLKGELKAPKVQSDGFLTGNDRWDERDSSERTEKARKRVALQVADGTLIEETLLGWYEKTIRLAKQNHIRVVLIGYPLSKEYLEALEPIDRQIFDGLTVGLINRHGVEFWDFHAVFADRPDLFMNEDHLNADGARALGELIASRLSR